MLRGLAEPFARFLAQTGAGEVLDLCSGGAGPALVLIEELRRAGLVVPRFVLTDLYPLVPLWRAARKVEPEAITFHPEPLDATRIPADLAAGRARAIVNAFHHFRPQLARSILADAVAGSEGIFISEAFERNPLRFLPFVPSAIPAALANPLMASEGRMRRAMVLPLVFPVGAWDGIVSTLRVYSEEELRDMVAPFGDRFRWEYGTYRYPMFGKGTYFFGVPR